MTGITLNFGLRANYVKLDCNHYLELNLMQMKLCDILNLGYHNLFNSLIFFTAVIFQTSWQLQHLTSAQR